MSINKSLKNLAFAMMRILPDCVVIQLLFLKKFGRLADFEKPKTFNEKVNWRKLHQRDARLIAFSDKISAKVEAAKLIGDEYIIPTLWQGEKPEDIPYETLTPPYMIKTNHGCGNHIFIRTQADIDKQKNCSALRDGLGSVYGVSHREWAYQHIEPKILVERMLEMPDGNIPNDYKFFVYHGKVRFVQIDTDRFGAHKMAYFDRAWNKLPFTKGNPRIEEDVPRPLHYDLMIELAEKIGAQFDFARIDFYDLPSGVYFGEVTFYPAGGFGRFYPDEWDEKFGEPWKINAKP